MIALGAFETNSVAAGTACCDEAVKSCDINILDCGAVCAGKYIAVFSGTAASVRSALSVARASLPDGLFWQELNIANVHSGLLRAFSGGCAPVEEAIGAFESYSVINSIFVADTILKRSDISIVDLRPGRGLGGKSVVVFTGPLPEVKDCCKHIEYSAEPKALVSDVVLIESPAPAAVMALVGGLVVKGSGCESCGGIE